MKSEEFEELLAAICNQLTDEARDTPFIKANEFEERVRKVAEQLGSKILPDIDFTPHPQAFPDIDLGDFGIEVKFTKNDSWRSVANSVQETNRIESVKHVYLVFGKMGGEPEVRWGKYEQCVMHVRTSHVPRFEVEIGAKESLFDRMGIQYDEFRISDIHKKMEYVRLYARGRLKKGERLWWLEDSDGQDHTLPIQARLYTKLEAAEKKKLRAEAVLLCPQIVKTGRSRDKYDDVVLYLLTYHGVLCHQARDLFSAGSVANPKNDNKGGIYIQRAIELLEDDILVAAQQMDGALFKEYWGKDVEPRNRIKEWLQIADSHARDWTPSEVLFLGKS
ncbi:hypothetical protein GCM10011369_06010 [Neiella marina]|uniref:Restriction endonuclease n=1 Tax=Neiella marina TaxID=508461 RepID=A0A8J2XMW3_9GAMM|nr:hypothetical protein [Neiella marina]GGA67167.1 hypothetical protein GCM10011369_06010 [Neiella marina]